MGKTAPFEVSLLYNEYQAMETFGLSEIDFNLLPREIRARKVAYVLINNFVGLYRMWEGRPKGK